MMRERNFLSNGVIQWYRKHKQWKVKVLSQCQLILAGARTKTTTARLWSFANSTHHIFLKACGPLQEALEPGTSYNMYSTWTSGPNADKPAKRIKDRMNQTNYGILRQNSTHVTHFTSAYSPGDGEV